MQCNVFSAAPEFMLDDLNLHYCTRRHSFSIWYHNLKSLFSVLEPGLFLFQMSEFS